MDLAVKIGKIKLKNPIMVASGTFGYAEEFKDITDLKGIGAIITKSVTMKPKQGNKPPRLWETTAGLLNSIGLQNEGVEDFIKNKLPFLKSVGVPVIVSIAGETINEYAQLAKKLNIPAVSGLEINISCPNIKTKHRLFAQDAKAAASAVKAVKKNTKKTTITKLSPEVTDICEIARAVEKGGSDAISVINTIKGMAVDIETQKPQLGDITGGLSGPAIKPVALRIVWETTQTVRIPVIGVGGIMTADDAIEFLLCGATAVQIGTANFLNPQAVIAVAEGIEAYLKEKNLSNLKEIVGRLK
ncbi:MAG: dihydroorotate dehydrogenase [Candidatus Omnitrophota bacterium]|nr:MAG: dihydroorotate dehydrogenase [Candidatus Omnitrophota bacterium]